MLAKIIWTQECSLPTSSKFLVLKQGGPLPKSHKKLDYNLAFSLLFFHDCIVYPCKWEGRCEISYVRGWLSRILTNWGWGVCEGLNPMPPPCGSPPPPTISWLTSSNLQIIFASHSQCSQKKFQILSEAYIVCKKQPSQNNAIEGCSADYSDHRSQISLVQ